MRLGICCAPEKADDFLSAGFDYVEIPAFRLLEDTGYRAEVTNLFFPGSARFFGNEKTDWLDLGGRTIEAASKAGVQLMVLGSGGTRRAPEPSPDWDLAFVDIAVALDKVAQSHGIRVVPESLNKSETNVGNDLPLLAQMLRDKGCGYTADAYHVLQEEGPEPKWKAQLPFAPSHVHFASYDRKVPQPDDSTLDGFFARLNELGYSGRVSFEGSLEAFNSSEAAQALRAALRVCDSL